MSATQTPSTTQELLLPPSLATVQRRALMLLETGAPLHAELAQLVEVDPVLTGAVLRAVRCPLYGLDEAAHASVARALERVGRPTLLHMVRSMPQVHSQGRSRADVENACRQHVHGLAVAAAARWLSNTGAYDRPQEAFLAGLLHDLGQLAAQPDETVSDIEVRTEALMRRWNVSAAARNAARYHRRVRDGIPPESLGVGGKPLDLDTQRLLAVLARADQLASGLGFDDGVYLPELDPDDVDASAVAEAIELEIAHAAGLLVLTCHRATDFVRVLTNEELRLAEISSDGAIDAPRGPRTAVQVAEVHRELMAMRALPSVPAILSQGLQRIRDGLGFDRVILLEADPEDALRLRGRAILDPSEIEYVGGAPGLELLCDARGALSGVLETGRPALGADQLEDRGVLQTLSVEAFAAASLRAGSASFGVVVADHFFSARPLTDGDAAVLGLLCDALGMVLQNVALDVQGRKLRSLAEKDELTGINNRRNIVNLLQDEIERAHRYRKPLSIALIDVDHFKLWNDHHGHQVGDIVLQAVAQLIASCSRELDHYGRYGGEEFLVVLPDTPVQHAVLYSERLRVTLAGHGTDMFRAYEGTSLAASVGVTSLEAGDTVDTMIRRADTALYAAKKHGRNRVCVEATKPFRPHLTEAATSEIDLDS